MSCLPDLWAQRGVDRPLACHGPTALDNFVGWAACRIIEQYLLFEAQAIRIGQCPLDILRLKEYPHA
jgi:hypothetical protein